MSDYGDIVSTLARLFWALDHHDRTEFSDCWAEDVRLDIEMADGRKLSFDGRQDLLDRTTGNWTAEPSALRHQLGAVQVTLESPTRARARFYCSYIGVGPDGGGFKSMGQYQDVLVKGVDGRWRVRERAHDFLLPLAIGR